MKIQTNAGEVELTAEMVCRGMVLTDAEGDIAVLMDRFVHYECMWSVKGWAADESTPPLAPCWVACLGCDPTIATRADCERYGVHGDAGAHGFARLKNGGAVDLRRIDGMPAGTVGQRESGTRWTSDGPTGMLLSTFVGLDARRASPADVERLCCGAVFHDEHGGCGERCTLAIGDHDTHEDLATGAKWPAKAERYEYTARATSSGFRFVDPPHAATDKIRLKPYTWGAARDVVPPPAYFLHADFRSFPVTAEQFGDRWVVRGNDVAMAVALRGDRGSAVLSRGDDSRKVFALNVSIETLATCDMQVVTATLMEERAALFGVDYAVGPSTSAARKAESEATGRVCPGCKAEERRQKVGAVASTMLHKSGCRVVQEALLLALVAAVPEGLNPIGWRAAVLSAAERYRADVLDMPDRFRREVVALCRSGEPVPRGTLTAVVLAVVAYRRQFEPRVKAPPPERKRAPGLPIDDGGHYE